MSANQFFTLIISISVLNNEKCNDTAMNDSNNVTFTGGAPSVITPKANYTADH